jgi:hypothetical protein
VARTGVNSGSGPTGLTAIPSGELVVPGPVNPGNEQIRAFESCANDFDPSVSPGLDRPVGSRLHTRDGLLAWDKFGPAPTDWGPVGSGGGSSTATLDQVIGARASFLTGRKNLSYWSDPFITLPGGVGSLWRDLHAVDIHPINSFPGGVVQVASQTGYGSAIVDPQSNYPGVLADQAPSFPGVLLAANPVYLFTRFRIPSDPGSGGPGGWVDGEDSLLLGFVDSTNLKVVGVGIAIGQTDYGAVGGNVSSTSGTLGISAGVPRDFDTFHTIELYTNAGAWWVKVDNGAAVDVSALFPGGAVHGTPIMQVMSTGVLQPAVEVDHFAVAADRNAAELPPLGPDGGGGITELTGDGTAGPGDGSQVFTLSLGVVDNTILAPMAEATIKGRPAGAGAGDPVDLTGAQVNEITLQPVPIDAAPLAAAMSYVSPTWAAGTFRSLKMILQLSTSDPAVQPHVTLAGLAGTYATQITYSNGAAAGGFQDAANWNVGILNTGNLLAEILIETGAARALLGQAYSGGTAFTISANQTDTSNDVTGLMITFNSATTGRVRLWGIP